MTKTCLAMINFTLEKQHIFPHVLYERVTQIVLDSGSIVSEHIGVCCYLVPQCTHHICHTAVHKYFTCFLYVCNSTLAGGPCICMLQYEDSKYLKYCSAVFEARQLLHLLKHHCVFLGSFSSFVLK